MDDAHDLEGLLADLDATIDAEMRAGGDRPTLAHALHRRAQTLRQLGRIPEARAAYRQLARECGSDLDPMVEVVVAEGAFGRADMLWRDDDYSECLQAIEEYIQRRGEGFPTEDPLRLARAYRIRADALLEVGRPEESLVVCDAMFERFSDGDARSFDDESDRPPDPDELEPDLDAELDAEINRMLPIKVRALAAAGRGDDARLLCDQLLDAQPFDDPISRPAIAYLLALRAQLLDIDAPPEVVVAELEVMIRRVRGGRHELELEALIPAHALVWWRLQALQIDGALALTSDLTARLLIESEPRMLESVAETLEVCAHTLIYHSRFTRQRRNLLLAVAVRISDTREHPPTMRPGRGRLTATIALRQRLRNEAVRICRVLAERLDGELDPHLRQIRSEALLTEAEAWASTLHLARGMRLWAGSDRLGDGTWAAFTARAERSETRGDLPLMVIGNTLMGAMVGDDSEHIREVAAELVGRYERDRAPSTRIAVAFARLLSK